MSERHDVVLEGKVRAEADREAVLPDLAALVGRDLPFARELLSGRPVVLRSNVSREEADEAVAALIRIGVLAHAEPAPAFRIDADLDTRLGQRPRPALWNPNAAVNWSLLFTPVFGSLLHLRNWHAMQRSERIGVARTWLVVSVAVLVASIVASSLWPRSGNALRLSNFVYLLVWYFAAGKAQAGFVKREYGRDYVHKGWTKPLVLALMEVVASMFVAGMLQESFGTHDLPQSGTTRL